MNADGSGRARAFRFGVTLYPIESASPWTEAVKRAEQAGFDVVTVMDHFRSGGIWSALVSAHHAAPSLRVGTLVLNTDFWHPALLAREAITTDALTGGRLELGLGAGWDMVDYQTLGWERRPASVRIARLAETLEILGQAFRGETVDFRGDHYTVVAPEPWPRPLQARIPILIGGGGRGILSLAAKQAAIVSISRDLQRGAAASWRVADGHAVPDTTSERIDWVRAAAGPRFDDVELHAMLLKVVLTKDRRSAAADVGGPLGLSPEEVLASPNFLVGGVEEMAADLIARRARWGISYLTLAGGNASGANDLSVLVAVMAHVRAADL